MITAGSFKSSPRNILTCLAFLLCGAMSIAQGAQVADDNLSVSTLAAQTANPVIQWNKTLLVIVRTKGAQAPTVHPTRSFAIMHAAIYDAVNSIEGSHEPYLVELQRSQGGSQDAAVSSAAHAVLSALYPSFQTTLDTQLEQSLALLPDGAQKKLGVAIGRAVGTAVLALRSDDGSNAAPIPFVFGQAPGDYQSTPPNFPPQPQFTHWSRVVPFTLRDADQFRPGPPPALTSQTYTADFNQVKSVGIANSTTATADQALTGKFWNGAIQNYWNEIAQTSSLAHQLTTAQSARLFALLNLTLADGVIAFYDAKYTYHFWRPVTAIRAADSDPNPETLADPNWLPEVGNTAPDPSYPGAHAVISEAAATILATFFRADRFPLTVTSETMPGVERNFTSFSAAEREASLSRVFAGVHFQSDEAAGEVLGQHVARFVLGHFLLPVSHEGEDPQQDR